MAKLPVKQAASLADSMAKQGLSGSIMMGKKSPMPAEEDHSDDYSDDGDGLKAVCDELADVLSDGDPEKKDKIMSLLDEFKDRLQAKDMEQDKMESDSDSY